MGIFQKVAPVSLVIVAGSRICWRPVVECGSRVHAGSVVLEGRECTRAGVGRGALRAEPVLAIEEIALTCAVGRGPRATSHWTTNGCAQGNETQ